MKLSRQTTTDTAVIEGTRSDLWGRKHYFIIENAPRAELMAIDELLDAAGWESDHCPNYEDDDAFGHAGYTCGYWIDLDDVASFKADYKRLKSQVSAHIAAQITTASKNASEDVVHPTSQRNSAMNEQLSDEKLHQLEVVVTNYRTTHQAHLANPLDGAAVQAWDEATRQLMAVINNDEANIIAQLMARRDSEITRHESDMARVIAAWQTASEKLSEQVSQQPEFHLRRVGGDEELYAPCGKDYPRGRAYYVKPVVSLVTVKCPPCDRYFDSVDAATAYRDEQWRNVLREAGVLVTPDLTATVQPSSGKALSR
ncbi:hypothetical protein J6187_003765 [Salmonella enterica]|nr:hypothetical protein [Salmonella enterica]EHG9741788.1 hypothetical protein [Salmonella enterica]